MISTFYDLRTYNSRLSWNDHSRKATIFLLATTFRFVFYVNTVIKISRKRPRLPLKFDFRFFFLPSDKRPHLADHETRMTVTKKKTQFIRYIFDKENSQADSVKYGL